MKNLTFLLLWFALLIGSLALAYHHNMKDPENWCLGWLGGFIGGIFLSKIK